MTKRGRVLRGADNGPGLLMVEGQQYQFVPEGIWKSELPPRPGQIVEVEFDPQGTLLRVLTVSDSQIIRERAKTSSAPVRKRSVLSGSRGVATLLAVLILTAAWFLLPVVSIQTPTLDQVELTVWDALGHLNSDRAGMSLDRDEPLFNVYRVFAVVALAAPLLPIFWKKRIAILGGAVPAVFIVIFAFGLRGDMESRSAVTDSTRTANTAPAGHANEGNPTTVSLSAGAYALILVTLYMAVSAARSFAASSTKIRHLPPESRKAA